MNIFQQMERFMTFTLMFDIYSPTCIIPKTGHAKHALQTGIPSKAHVRPC